MNAPEHNLWQRTLKALTVPRGMPTSLQRIEDMLKAGVPDVYSVTNGHSVWLELKARRTFPKRAATPVLGGKGLSQEQKNWHLEHSMHGGKVCTLIGVGSYDYFLVSGQHSDAVNAWTKSELEEHSLCCGRAPLFWFALNNLLQKGQV